MNSTESHFCQIVGWASALQPSRRDVVAIYEPRFCRNIYPQAFCSPIDWASQETCSAYAGSPVVCGENKTVSGVLLGNGFCDGDAAWNDQMLTFLSVGEFHEWIEEQISGAEKLAKLSSLLTLSAMLINLKNFF